MHYLHDWVENLRYGFWSAKFLGVAVPDLAKFGGFLLAGLILGRFLRFILIYWIERITPKDDHTTSVRVATGFERSTFFVIFAFVLSMGAVDVLHLPGWLWDRVRLVPPVMLAISLTILFLQIIDVILLGLRKRWEDSSGRVDDFLINFLRKGARIFVILIATLITAQKLEWPVAGAIAGLGVGGAAFALAAQGLIANILGTIEIVADKLYHVGDRVQFDQFDGFVMEVGLRSTRIRALTGEQIRIPNRKMAEAQLRNFSRNGLVRTNVVVGLIYSTTQDQLRQGMQILDQIFKNRKDVESHQIYLKNLGTYSIDLEVLFWARYENSAEYNTLIGEIHIEVKRLFDQAKIEFAFPTQTLNINAPALLKNAAS